MPLVFAAACFLLLLFHFLAFGGGREPPLASRASIPLLFLSVQSRRFLESSFLLTFYESLNVTGVEEGID